MTNLLSGISSLAYQGTNAASPPNARVMRRDPVSTDWQNFSLMDIWLNELNQNVWILVSLAGNVGLWQLLASGGGNTETLTGNSGGAITPLASNINVLGDGTTINVAGNPGTHTLTISAIGTGVDESLTGNSGGAVFPTAGNINVRGDGTTITVAGNPGTSTLTVSIVAPVSVANGGTGAITLTGVLIGNGTSAITGNPITQHDVLIGGASNAITSLTNGTTGQILTAQTGANPIWASAGASTISITGDSGGALTSNSFTLTGGTTGLTFAGAGSTETLGGTLAIANGGTNATSMTNTDGVVYYDGTRLVTTAVGSATQVLTSNGAGVAPTFQAAGGGGSGSLVLIQTQTAAAVAALNFTTGISATYRNYLILFDNVICPTGSADIFCVQISINGGSSYIASGYLDSSGATIGLTLASISDNTQYLSGNNTLMNLTSGAGYIMNQGTYLDFDAGTASPNSKGGIYNTAATTVNALRVVVDATRTWSGVVSLYGYTK